MYVLVKSVVLASLSNIPGLSSASRIRLTMTFRFGDLLCCVTHLIVYLQGLTLRFNKVIIVVKARKLFQDYPSTLVGHLSPNWFRQQTFYCGNRLGHSCCVLMKNRSRLPFAKKHEVMTPDAMAINTLCGRQNCFKKDWISITIIA